MNRTLIERRGFNHISDPAFNRCNDAFDGMLKKWGRAGAIKATDHKESITQGDMEKIQVLFQNVDYPSTLTRKFWFLATYHFGLLGRELQAKP